MALRALHGFTAYQRQDLFGGAYGLTNSPSGSMALTAADPVVIRPDYWVAFLWKRLLGPRVLNATSSDPRIRAYAFAGPPPSPFAEPACASAAQQVLLLNLDAGSAHVSLPPGSPAARYAAWSLTSGAADGDPFSLLAALNGSPLPTTVDAAVVNPATFLSSIEQPPVTGRAADGVVVPALSTTFVCY